MKIAARKSGLSGRERIGAQLAETYKYILANLELNPSIQQGSKTILITSSCPGEGKTFTSTNLAKAIAESNKRVLLIDANLRHPQLHTELQLSPESGLSNVLQRDAKFRESLIPTTTTNLSLLPGGLPDPEASNLLSSVDFFTLLNESKKCFDVVLIDSPPVLSVSDALVIARAVDGVILVVDSKKTSRLIAERALSALRRANENIIGGVLNRIPKNHKSSLQFVAVGGTQ